MHDNRVNHQLAATKVAGFNTIGDFLSTSGIKPTRQRVAIATHMYERDQHLSADAILERVNQDSSTTNVSKATVYNTLKLFVREGILREVAIDPQRILFDTNTHNHHHVLDIESGEIRDIEPLQIDASKITGLESHESIAGIDLCVKVRSNQRD